MGAQHVALLDEVCWFFPELKIVVRHGAEPWTELMVKLMLKWPNLYYSTSAFAPKHYPEDIINYANTRGADKIIYAGYYSAGLSLDRIFDELNAAQHCAAVHFIHRLGWVPVGAASLFVRVLAPHRGEALRFLADSIDRMKADVPIWKRA